MSIYDPMRLGMRFMPAQEHSSVQGCGDPKCPICLPKMGAPGDARLGGSSGGGGRDDVLQEAIRSALLTRAVEYIQPSAFGFAGDPVDAPTQRDSAAFRSAKDKVKDYLLETSHDLGWDDVVGNEPARVALMEAIEDPIKHADLYAHYGRKPLKGVLMYGPPGCGKTMFGKAAAAALGRLHGTTSMLIKINGPEIQTPYVGQTEEIIRNIFAFAQIYRKERGHPLTIFMDEADAILPARSGSVAPWHASNVATFLAEMDGVEESGAFVILATNRPEAIDSALLRDGRCDRKIKIERPNLVAAQTILSKAMAGAPLMGDAAEVAREAAADVFGESHVVDTLTVQMDGHVGQHKLLLRHIVSGAMLVGVVERAKGIAFRRDMADGTRTGITQRDLTAAISEVRKENVGLDHSYALREFAQGLAPRRAGMVLQ